MDVEPAAAEALADDLARASLDSSRSLPLPTTVAPSTPTTAAPLLNGSASPATSTFSPPTPSLPPPPPSMSNGPATTATRDEGTELASQLAQVRAEKETLEGQYRGLLSKLTTMRSTLGDKLKQDADELDRRADQIATLQAANDDLTYTVETLRSELVDSNADGEAAHRELDLLRSRAFDSQRQTSDEAAAREVALREAQEDLERVREDRERWEADAGRERVAREAATAQLAIREREVEALAGDAAVLKQQRDAEAESAANLQTVLEEFQQAKDRELRETLGDLQDQLQASSRALADYRQRAATAESQLSSMQSDSERSLSLQREVKEKNLLIGKLRHEAVILNEHLTEALRRLKKDTSENSVDRRLVTNVLISFFNTPRADTKRFEMLSLLASILSWNDDDRERAGLQRSSGSSSQAGPSSSISPIGPTRARGHSRTSARGADEVLGDNETFSNLWIEFLLREASQPSTPADGQLGRSAKTSESSMDRYPLPPDTPLSPSPQQRRRPSFSGSTVSSTAPSSIMLSSHPKPNG